MIKTLLISLGGIIAGCMSTDQAATDKQPSIELLKAQGNVVVSLAAVETQVMPGASVELKFRIENSSADNFKVLPWGTPLENVLSADIFQVIYKGEPLAYQGRVIKRAPPTDADYIELAAGEIKEVTVNLSQAYDTRTAGSYQVQLKTTEGKYAMHGDNLPVASDPVVIERL